MKMHCYLTMSALVALIGLASINALANGEPIYQFLPSEKVVDNVRALLQAHGVDATAIQIDADTHGIVQLNGQVSSKAQVDLVTHLAKQAEGAYAVLSALRYSSGEVIAAPLPAGLDPVMDIPSAPGSASEHMDAR